MTTDLTTDIQYSVEADIRASAEFVALMQESAFCVELWSALVNVDWLKVYDSNMTTTDKIFDILMTVIDYRLWSGSFRYVAGIIADIRNTQYNTDEDYMDWYCCGGYGIISDRIELAMKQIGWIPSPDQSDTVI